MKNNLIVRVVVAAAVFAALSVGLLTNDAFEGLYEFTRRHESWELDELVLVILAGLIVTPVWVAVELKLSRDQVRRAAQEQLALEQELSEARRGQAMGSLAGGMAHSGNNMLQAILTLARTAQKRLPTDSSAQEVIGKIIQSASQASDIFQSVLQLSRNEQRSGYVIDLGDCLRGNMGVLGTTVAANVTVDLQDIEPGYQVPISEAECTDMMLVLLSNASDAYKDKAGTITVRLACSERDSGKVILMVADRGSGIPDDVQQRVFDPFFTTKSAGEGTGIGLPIVRRIAERAGGSVSFTSMVNHGTTFVIELPVAGGR